MSNSLTSILVVLIRVAGVGFQALLVVVLANAIPIAEMGLFSAVYIFWSLTRMLGPAGLDHIAMRDIAAFGARDDMHRVDAVSGFTLAAVGSLGMLVAAVAFAVLYAGTGGGAHGYTVPAIAAAALAAPAYALNGLLVAQLRGLGRTLQSQISEAVTLHALALLAFVALKWGGGLTLESALIAQAAAAWTVCVIYAVLRLRCGIDRKARLDARERKVTTRDALQVWQALALGGLSDRGPAYISLAMLGPAATAIVDIAIRFGTLPTIFTDGVATTFAPVYARLHATSETGQYRSTLTASSWLAFAPAFGALAGLVVLGPWLLATFFPPSYQQAYWPLVLVCAASVVNAGFGLASSAFIVTQRQTLVRTYSAYGMVARLSACAVLGYFYGPIGIAAAFLLGSIVRDGGLARILAREHQGPVMLDPSALRAIRGARATAR